MSVLLLCLNRTKLGLKPVRSKGFGWRHIGLNRTKLGLKHVYMKYLENMKATSLNRTKLGLKRVEASRKGTARHRLNRTKLGLKRSEFVRAIRMESQVLIEPSWD